MGKGTNGNGGDVSMPLEALKARLDADGKVMLDDLVEVQVLTLFFVQKLGKASNRDLQERFDAVGAVVNPHLLAQATEALQGRKLLSYGRGRAPSGENMRQWVMRRAIWSSPLEVAHISDLLPKLIATAETSALLDELNDQEREDNPAGGGKAQRKLGYQDYVDCRAEFVTLDEMIGSQPASPWLDELIARSPHGKDVKEANIRFWRDYATGAIKIGSDAVRGWLRTGLRSIGFSDAVAQYVSVSDITIVPEKPLIQVALPVIDPRTKEGKGLNTHECLQPGQRFTILFRIPTHGFLTADQFKVWLAAYGPAPIRGLSPARSARFGKVALVAFEELGDTRAASSALASVRDRIPAEHRAFYDGLAREAEGMNFRRGRGVDEAE